MLNLSINLKPYLMKIKFLFAIVAVSFLLSVLGCQQKMEVKDSITKGVFNGLYTLEYKDWDKQHIWIFTNDILYTLYPASLSDYGNPTNNVAYEIPVHYYVKDNMLYTCGIDVSTGKATTFEKCLKDGSEPDYNIISIDTIHGIDGRRKEIIIRLEKYIGKSQMKLTKHF